MRLITYNKNRSERPCSTYGRFAGRR
jgi:hypothetical protein